MKLKVFSPDGSSHVEKDYDLPEFEGNKGLQTLKDLLVTYHANRRQGSASSKSRAEVAGSGRKLYRQKGTGNARKGDGQSPVYVGGGIAHGPKPRDWSRGFNVKARRLAFGRAIFDKASEGRILLIEKFDFDAPKTRNFCALLEAIVPDAKTVLVSDQQFDKNAALSARNIKNVALVEAPTLNAWDVVRHHSIVLTEKGFEQLLTRVRAPSTNASNKETE